MSGSGEERTWTINVCQRCHRNLDTGIEEHCQCEPPAIGHIGHYVREVVEASAYRAEREAREELSEALREADRALNEAGYGGTGTVRQRIFRALSALPAQKEER